MSTRAGRTIQIVLGIVLVLAAIRLVLIYQGRHQEPVVRAPQARQKPLDPDYYVVPRKSHAYDLKTARAALVGHPAWVLEGYKFTYYPYDQHQVDFGHPAGVLGPLEPLDIRAVVGTSAPGRGDAPQIVAVFNKAGRQYALPIGARRGTDETIYADDMLLFEDPRQLYRHWKPEVWQAIERHEVHPGMNEMQALFALGMGIPQAQGDSPGKTVVYPSGGKPVVIVFRGGEAAEIRASTASAAR